MKGQCQGEREGQERQTDIEKRQTEDRLTSLQSDSHAHEILGAHPPLLVPRRATRHCPFMSD